MKVLSLFDGIGCGMVALERAGIPVERYVAYEIDKYAIQISKKNYPQIEHCGDVTTADFTQYRGFDLLIGGIAKNKTDERFNPNLFYERIFVSALVREDIINRSEAKIAKRIVKGKIKSQEDLNCLLDSIDDVTDLQDIEDFIYDILY